ncbi:MAG TPA: carbohydrate porin [Bacteroidia bacterium]|nr:carbohydrate porin [Bacteroidia bacterium]
MKKIPAPFFALLIFCVSAASAQTDSTEKWSWHYQFTGVMQGHAAFHAPYAGQNSLDSTAEQAFSVTSTFYFGRRLWTGGELYFNPEIAGGKGISSALGIAGFTNGECFRIGDPSPALYVARVFVRQQFGLGDEKEWLDAGANQLAGWVPAKRITLTVGKVSLADIYDANSYSHDPRTQFMNWSLMSNGAWDYAANTRGYTWAGMAEWHTPVFSARYCFAMMPKVANGSVFDMNIGKANEEAIELEKSWGKDGSKTTVRVLGFYNMSHARSYQDAILQYHLGNDTTLDVNTQTTYGGKKYGFGINAETQLFNGKAGVFVRGGWNDGKTATWVFTEIDMNSQVGIQLSGSLWKRSDDVFGLASSVNEISKDHQDFLNTGGYGFIIGDGKLPDYAPEVILETYYSAQITDNFWLSADYQHVQNPAYNADRGPVNVWAVRGHVAF